MQTANVLLALGGDMGNSVPITGATAAEISVLRAIHGDTAVHEIDPAGDIERGSREELARLVEKYPARDGEGRYIVRTVYPGVSPALATSLNQLDLPDELYRTLERVKPAASKANKRMSAAGKKAEKKAETEKTADADADDDAEGEEKDDDDNGLFD